MSLILILPHMIFTRIGDYSFSFTQLGPSLALLIYVYITKQKDILEKIKNNMITCKSLILYPIILVSFFIVMWLCNVILSLYGIPYKPWNGSIMFYILNILSMIICCAGEEFGWRGFLLPLLNKKYSLFTSSVILGVMWGIWHLNLSSVLGFFMYVLYITELSIIMAWIYSKTNADLKLMILIHFSFNFFSHVFTWQRFVAPLFVIEAIVFGIIAGVIVLFNLKRFFSSEISE